MTLMVLHLACFDISFICQTQIKKNPANNQRLGSAGEINAKALAPTVAVQAYCQIAFYAFAAFLCNSNLDIRIVGFSGCPQYTVTRSIVIIIVYCYEYHDVNNFLCDSFPNANHSSISG